MSVLRRKWWQSALVVLLVVMLTLNLRMLISREEYDEFNDPKLCDQPLVVNIDSPAGIQKTNVSEFSLQWSKISSDQVKMMGRHRSNRGFLTIGIPSIKREGGMASRYLIGTISSLIENTSAKDKTNIVVIVFLADMDAEYNNHMASLLAEKFADYLDAGFIQILQVSKDFYPQLTGLKRNFNDKPDRVQWRSKQVSDFAFMFLYAQNISSYYLQIEDDVVSARSFVPSIRNFIGTQKQWAVLEFSELGFIGKLFKSSDLEKLAHYMLTFYDEQPVDWLITFFRLSMAQKKVILRKPTLFQHIGLKSSFDTSKDNKLKDRFFDDGKVKWDGNNPPATIVTNITAFEKNSPDLAYSAESGFFWASNLHENDSVYVVFNEPQALEKIVIITGDDRHPNDKLKHGWLEVSSKMVALDSTANRVVCENFHRIADFDNGHLEASNLSKSLTEKSHCLKIVVGKTQKEWVIFQQIAVYTKT